MDNLDLQLVQSYLDAINKAGLELVAFTWSFYGTRDGDFNNEVISICQRINDAVAECNIHSIGLFEHQCEIHFEVLYQACSNPQTIRLLSLLERRQIIYDLIKIITQQFGKIRDKCNRNLLNGMCHI